MGKVAKRRGRYVLDYYDHLGRRRRKSMPAGTKKAEAEEELRSIQDRLAKGYYRPDREIPRFEDLAAVWSEFKKNNVRRSTWDTYDGHVRNHFEDINPMKVNRVTVAVVERFIAGKLRQKVSPATLKKILITFNQIMQYAVRHRYIDHNPVRDAERPRAQASAQKAAMHVLDRAQVAALVNAVENPKYKVMFALAVLSGLRQGELIGLRWPDVKWESSQIHIQRSYNHNAWNPPKSESSNRLVDIGPGAAAMLWEWSTVCPKSDLSLIFPSKSGKPLHYSNVVRRFFQPALKKAGLPRIRFHDLRHTYASLLIDQGENIKYIQNQMGHSKPDVTLNVYAHLLTPSNPESAAKLEDSIFKQPVTKRSQGPEKIKKIASKHIELLVPPAGFEPAAHGLGSCPDCYKDRKGGKKKQ